MITDNRKHLYFEGSDDASEYRVRIVAAGETPSDDDFQTLSKDYETPRIVDGVEKISVEIELSELEALENAEGTFDIYATMVEASTDNETEAATLTGIEFDFLPLAAPSFIGIE